MINTKTIKKENKNKKIKRIHNSYLGSCFGYSLKRFSFVEGVLRHPMPTIPQQQSRGKGKIGCVWEKYSFIWDKINF